jgi:hypothetical protein
MSKRKARSDDEFYIHCSSNHNEIATVVTVSPQEAIKMQQACEYFSKVFEHGTVEADTRTIKKEDWTPKTVSHLVQLLTTGSAVVKGLDELRDLAAAANQVIYDYHLQSPIESGKALSSEETHKFLELVVSDKFVFSVSLCGELKFEKKFWDKLWMKEIILLGSDWDTYIILAGRSSNDQLKKKKVNKYSNRQLPVRLQHQAGTYFSYPLQKATELHVYCDNPMTALSELKGLFASSKNSKNDTEAFNLRIPEDLKLSDEINSAVARQTGGRIFSYDNSTVSDHYSNQPKHMRLSGSFDLLYSVFKEVRRYLTGNKVCLNVVTDNPETIGRLVNACLLCQDHKGSIGIYKEAEFLIVKTIHDMNIVLEYMASSDATNIIEDKFQVKFVRAGHFKIF